MRRRGIVRLSADEEKAAADARTAKWREERELRRLQVAREALGTARGFRYAIECEAGWVGPNTRPGPHVHEDCCTHREPVIFEGDRESAQARAQIHRERNERGGACHHSPAIVHEDAIAKRAKVRGWA